MQTVASSRAGRAGLVAALGTGLAMSAAPVAHAAPDDWAVVAHRGGIVAAPEHTKAAFRHMIGRGVDGVELDIRFTRDRKPVVFHDAVLNRTTDCTGSIAKIKLRALQRCDAGSWFDEAFRGAEVLTLGQALSYIKGRADRDMRYYLHVKSDKRSEAKKILRTVRKRGLQSRTVVISGSRVGLKRLDQAGFAKSRLGYVFNEPSGWSTGYKYLIPYNVTSNPAVLRGAERRGQRVLPVQSHPHTLRALARLDLFGVLADDVDAAMVTAGRLARIASADPPPAADFETGDPEMAPEGEIRRTGPMDF